MVLTHFKALLGPLGIYQHARGRQPRLEEGYCTDDNARALQFLTELIAARQAEGDLQAEVTIAAQHCWQFVIDAQAPNGRFRNFRDVHGRWLDADGSEETQAHTLRALASVVKHTKNEHQRQAARVMMERLLPHVLTFQYARSVAEAAIGLADMAIEDVSAAVLRHCQRRLLTAWDETADASWHWFESQLTYANALLPHGVLMTMVALGDRSEQRAQDVLETSARFLVQATIREAVFHPIGNDDWYDRGGARARFDQQPIEAHTMFDFLLSLASERSVPVETVAAPYLWFLGHNSEGLAVADGRTGACGDGLRRKHVNENCGAESTMAYLRSELLLERAAAAVRQGVARQRQQLPHAWARAESPT